MEGNMQTKTYDNKRSASVNLRMLNNQAPAVSKTVKVAHPR